MPSYELMTAKVVDEVMGMKLMRFPVKRELYYEKDSYGSVSYFGFYSTEKAAKVSWRAELRSRGVHA